jgi:hypothetical protein
LLTEGGMSETSAIKGGPASFDLFNKAGRAIPGIHFCKSTKALEKMTDPNHLSYTSRLEDFFRLFDSIELSATLVLVAMHVQF